MTYDDRGQVWRTETPHVLAALLRRSSDFEACEDAVQEALLAAAAQWPEDGVPDYPRGWLIRVASRKLIDFQRSQTARARREMDAAVRTAIDERHFESAASTALAEDGDDTLRMLVLCAHPALTGCAWCATSCTSPSMRGIPHPEETP